MTGGASGYDWSRPFKPPGMSIWIADHRRGVRLTFFVIDLALLVEVILTLIDGDIWWLLYIRIIVWAGLTYQAGWLIPASVDRWRADERRQASPG